jgi:CRP-like cAMP-binding protein
MATASPPADDVDPVAALLRKLRLRDEVTPREEAALRGAIDGTEAFDTGAVIVEEGRRLDRCLLIVTGFVARAKSLDEGARQITEVQIPGDFIDLHGFMLKRLDHRLEALAPTRLASASHQAIRAITEAEPHLGRLLWLHTLIDASIQRERLLSIGRRTAIARIAHLLCELFVRLDVIGAVDGASFRLPVTQIDLADASGLTSVHVNRMLRQLRDQELVTFRNGVVDIHDLAALKELAAFEPDYLLLEAEPR